jgi:hypothetical protein
VKIDGNEDDPAMTIPAAASLMPESFAVFAVSGRVMLIVELVNVAQN